MAFLQVLLRAVKPPPSAGLQIVPGLAEEKESSIFEAIDHANRVIALVMGRCIHVATALSDSSGLYIPLVAEAKRTGEILCHLWIDGFGKAANLRPTAWSPLLEIDLQFLEAMGASSRSATSRSTTSAFPN